MITLKKAIEILDLNVREAGSKMPPDTLDALNLSIENMKYVQHLRELGVPGILSLLPGEIAE